MGYQGTSSSRGFTLVEVMIVVGILGVLASLAIPAYQDYVIRTQVTEGLNFAAATRASVAEYYLTKGTWPGNNSAIGLGSASSLQGKYVSGVRLSDGGITVTFGNEAHAAVLNGHTVGLTPAVNADGEIVWRCGTSPAPAGNTVDSAAQAPTTVEGKFLPTACR